MKNSIPNRYKLFLDHRILQSEYCEKSYSCSPCDMAQEGHYKQKLKCCTYFPFLSNFIVGEILFQGGVPAKILRHKILEKRTLPIGIFPDPGYKLEYKMAGSTEFGKHSTLACLFLSNSGACQIWPSRNSMCSSFHCKSSYGNEGYTVWNRYHDFFNYVELNFSQIFMLEASYQWSEILDNLNWYENNHVEVGHPFLEADVYREAWGNWYGRELEFFESSWNWFSSLTKEVFWRDCGDEGERHYERLCEALSCAIAKSCRKLKTAKMPLLKNLPR